MRAALTAPTERLHIVTAPSSGRIATFAQDVASGLCAQPKKLNSKYFYDAVGSALFGAIMLMPEYYLTRAESEILNEWGWEIVRALGSPVEFIELGSGSADKTRILIGEALRVQRTLNYLPVDISEDALRTSAGALVETYPQLHVTGYVGDYLALLDTSRLHRTAKVMMMFMGSNIGNYEPAEATALLKKIAKNLKSGDGFLLGVDLKKDRNQLLPAYDDPTGVTAAFNKNLLARINRELGGTFTLEHFAHLVEYDETDACVRSYLQSKRAQNVEIAKGSLKLAFAPEERIHTESAYKYTPETLAKLAESARLRVARTWTDPAERFAVTLLVPA